MRPFLAGLVDFGVRGLFGEPTLPRFGLSPVGGAFLRRPFLGGLVNPRGMRSVRRTDPTRFFGIVVNVVHCGQEQSPPIPGEPAAAGPDEIYLRTLEDGAPS
jgi:hypothetical protein